jgi:hypothetical protein
VYESQEPFSEARKSAHGALNTLKIPIDEGVQVVHERADSCHTLSSSTCRCFGGTFHPQTTQLQRA